MRSSNTVLRIVTVNTKIVLKGMHQAHGTLVEISEFTDPVHYTPAPKGLFFFVYVYPCQLTRT